MNANVAEQAVSTTIESAIIVLFGWWAGARHPGGAGGVAVRCWASVLPGTIFGAFSPGAPA